MLRLEMNLLNRFLLMAWFVAVMTPIAYGQDNDNQKHPIDITLEHCLEIDSNQTTYGMIQCTAVAREEWDKEMNKFYKMLMDTLGSEEKETLRKAQRHWLEYRDNEVAFAGSMYYNMQGTMWRVVAAGRICDIVKQRAVELKEYYDLLTIDKQK